MADTTSAWRLWTRRVALATVAAVGAVLVLAVFASAHVEVKPGEVVVSQITWKATGPGIAQGQFQDFPVRLGVLPTSGELVFKAVQKYSSGEVVVWNETAVGDAEPEHPAPTLKLTAPEAEGQAGGETTSPPSDQQAPEASGQNGDDEDDAGDWIAIVLAAAALAVSLGAVGVIWKRNRT